MQKGEKAKAEIDSEWTRISGQDRRRKLQKRAWEFDQSWIWDWSRRTGVRDSRWIRK